MMWKTAKEAIKDLKVGSEVEIDGMRVKVVKLNRAKHKARLSVNGKVMMIQDYPRKRSQTQVDGYLEFPAKTTKRKYELEKGEDVTRHEDEFIHIKRQTVNTALKRTLHTITLATATTIATLWTWLNAEATKELMETSNSALMNYVQMVMVALIIITATTAMITLVMTLGTPFGLMEEKE